MAETEKNWVDKLQALPSDKKKIVLWGIIIIICLVWGFFFLKNTRERLNNADVGGFIKKMNLPSVGEEINSAQNSINNLKNDEKTKELQTQLEQFKENADKQDGQP